MLIVISITDIAMSFGFWHLGRFAGAYKLLFGCSPTETRRRVWDLRGAALLVLSDKLDRDHAGGCRLPAPIDLAESG